MAEHPLWIEKLGERELVDTHWEYVQLCMTDDWNDEFNNRICDALRAELKIRSFAE